MRKTEGNTDGKRLGLIKNTVLAGFFLAGVSSQMSASVNDTLSVSIEENDWEGGISVSFGVDSISDGVRILVEKQAVPVSYYDISGRRMDGPLVGALNIILYSDGTRNKEIIAGE